MGARSHVPCCHLRLFLGGLLPPADPACPGSAPELSQRRGLRGKQTPGAASKQQQSLSLPAFGPARVRGGEHNPLLMRRGQAESESHRSLL